MGADDSRLHGARHAADVVFAMATEEERIFERVDAAFHWSGLLVRAGIYAVLIAVADLYDCGHALLTGLLLGDLVGQLTALCWQWRDHLMGALGDLVLIGIIFLFVRPQLVWPEEPALRAILGLAAFGVFAGKVGGSLLTHLGPREREFA
jgi:hypothetical protein